MPAPSYRRGWRVVRCSRVDPWRDSFRLPRRSDAWARCPWSFMVAGGREANHVPTLPPPMQTQRDVVGAQVEDDRGQPAEDEARGLEAADGAAKAFQPRLGRVAQEAAGQLGGGGLVRGGAVDDDDLDAPLDGDALGGDGGLGLDDQAHVFAPARAADGPIRIAGFLAHKDASLERP